MKKQKKTEGLWLFGTSKVGEGMGILDRIVGDAKTAKCGEVGTGTEFLPDIFGEGADVSAGADMTADGEFGIIVTYDFNRINCDFARW